MFVSNDFNGIIYARLANLGLIYFTAIDKDNHFNSLFSTKYSIKNIIVTGSGNTFSISPSENKIAFITQINNYSQDSHIGIVNLDDDKSISYSSKVFSIFGDSPPVWISDKRLIIATREGISIYDINEESLKIIIPGCYKYPVKWKNKLIFQELEGFQVFISNLDGSGKELFFKNNLLFGMLAVSPDERYLACCSRYLPGMKKMKIPHYSHLAVGQSVFIMSLEDKTFTYFLADNNKPYQKYLSWCCQ